MLCSIVHELSHYFQWIKDINLSHEQMERQVKYYIKKIITQYLGTSVEENF